MIIKDVIKKLAAEQVFYKPQRKSVYFTGDRILKPSEATAKVATNKNLLMHLHIAYDILRKKQPNLPKKQYWSQVQVDFLVKKYTEQEA